MKYFLGIDNGGTMVKAALFDKYGKEIATAGAHCVPIARKPGYSERDAEELFSANCKVCKEVIQKANIAPEDIAGVCITGHGKGLYLVGYDGHPSYPGIVSTDTRAWKYKQHWVNDGTEDRAYPITKQHILTSQPVCILAWMRDNEPEVMARTRYIFCCKDYIRYRMTDEAKAEVSDLSSTCLVDLNTGSYNTALLSIFGLEQYADKMPPLCRSTEIAGYITREISALTGIPEGTPVAGGTMDITACALAVGVISEDYLCMIAGTWSINEYISNAPVLDGSILLNSYFCLPGKYVIEESSPTSAVNNEWFVQNLLPEVKEASASEGKSVYEIINSWVSSVDCAEFCPVFLPFIAASNVHPNACGSFIGVSSYHTRQHIARSIYEGVVFSHRYHFEKLMKARLQPPKAIRLAGGPAQSDVWVQIFADATQLPVERVTAKETGTLGCAMLSAYAVGEYSSLEEACSQMCEFQAQVLPRLEMKDIYDRKYSLYLKAIDCLDSLWDDIQEYKDFC